MEYLSGYAAAKVPFSTYQVEPHPSPSHRSNRPTRSNSTSGTTAKRRSRIPGHARTNSASTSSSGGRTENHAPSHNFGGPQQPPGGTDHSRAGADAAPAIVTSIAAGRTDPSGEHHHSSPRDHTGHSWDRMPASAKHYQDKLLAATPRLNTHDTASRHLDTGSTSEPSSARTPASASATTPSAFGSSAATFPDRRVLQHAAMHPDGGPGSKLLAAAGAPRADSVSSVSGATTMSNRTMLSTEQPSTTEASLYRQRSFVFRNGRTYISDPSLPYPLPVDLEELHRQSLKTMFLLQLHGRPICAPAFADKPPARILEVGCGTGFWSMMCYRYYEARGQGANISFTGLDIVPLAPALGARSAGGGAPPPPRETPSADALPDKDMKWRFVQHDIRKSPFPFPDGSFDFIMAKDMGLAITIMMQQALLDEYVRILSPGGTLEIWETDHALRMLRPHVPEPATPVVSSSSAAAAASAAAAEVARDDGDDGDSDDGGKEEKKEEEEEDEHKKAAEMGVYVITTNTPLSTPFNTFLVEYNSWVSRALDARGLCPVPCALVMPLLTQECEALTAPGTRRLAVPLSEVRWEREGVGGVVTKDGKSYIETKARRVGGGGREGAGALPTGKPLEPAAAALRRTALMVVVKQIQSLEPILREVSGKSQDEWDAWMGKMMNDLVRENGTSWGECLEVGAWWAQKR
ncbi:hypothetical protein VTK56DRAFT_2575 [Thermocarpiscus australiensis]